jgi:hypothetical protein
MGFPNRARFLARWRGHGTSQPSQSADPPGRIRAHGQRPVIPVSFQSFALPEFWKCYESLPANVRVLADAKFALFQSEPFHPSLALKQKGEVWTVDIGRSYRAIAYREGNDFHWFWIGTHEAYNNLLPRFA